MPVIRIDTNALVEKAREKVVLADLSQLAASLLGKPEDYVMVHLHAGQTMLFAGTDGPLAYVELKSIGLKSADCAELSKALSAFLQERLGIEPSRIYIEFTAAAGSMWGWNGATF